MKKTAYKGNMKPWFYVCQQNKYLYPPTPHLFESTVRDQVQKSAMIFKGPDHGCNLTMV